MAGHTSRHVQAQVGVEGEHRDASTTTQRESQSTSSQSRHAHKRQPRRRLRPDHAAHEVATACTERMTDALIRDVDRLAGVSESTDTASGRNLARTASIRCAERWSAEHPDEDAPAHKADAARAPSGAAVASVRQRRQSAPRRSGRMRRVCSLPLPAPTASPSPQGAGKGGRLGRTVSEPACVPSRAPFSPRDGSRDEHKRSHRRHRHSRRHDGSPVRSPGQRPATPQGTTRGTLTPLAGSGGGFGECSAACADAAAGTPPSTRRPRTRRSRGRVSDSEEFVGTATTPPHPLCATAEPLAPNPHPAARARLALSSLASPLTYTPRVHVPGRGRRGRRGGVLVPTPRRDGVSPFGSLDSLGSLDSPPCVVVLEPLNSGTGARQRGHARTASIHSEHSLLHSSSAKLDQQWAALCASRSPSEPRKPVAFPASSPGGMPADSEGALRRPASYHQSAASSSSPLQSQGSSRSATPSDVMDVSVALAQDAGLDAAHSSEDGASPTRATIAPHALVAPVDTEHPLVKVVGGRPCVLLPHLSPRRER